MVAVPVCAFSFPSAAMMIQWLQCLAADLQVVGLIPAAAVLFRWRQNVKRAVYVHLGAL